MISGFGGALYVWVHRRYVFFMRSNKVLNKFLQKNRFLYPGILALMVRKHLRSRKICLFLMLSINVFKVASVTYPNGFGRYIAGELSTHEQVSNLFTNFTWTQTNLNVEQAAIVSHWTNPHTNEVFSNLLMYLLYTVRVEKVFYVTFGLIKRIFHFSFFSRSSLRQFQFLPAFLFPCSKSVSFKIKFSMMAN